MKVARHKDMKGNLGVDGGNNKMDIRVIWSEFVY
jgi:hypothetical protein